MNQSPKFFYIFTCRGKYKKKTTTKIPMRRHRRAFRLIVQFRSVGRQHGGLVAGLLHTAFHPFRQGLLSPMKRI
jgi:hypothetical protein